jgi:hypothetical protein
MLWHLQVSPERIGRTVIFSDKLLNLPEEGYLLEAPEREKQLRALRRCNGNKRKSAVLFANSSTHIAVSFRKV